MQMSLQENAKDTDKARCASLEYEEQLNDEPKLGIDNRTFTHEDNETKTNISSHANYQESNLAIINNDPTMKDEITLDTPGIISKENKFDEIEIQIDDNSAGEIINQNSFHHESSIHMSDSNGTQALVNRKRLKLYIPNRKDESTRL